MSGPEPSRPPYPPPDHVLCHLPVELEVVDDRRSLAHLEVGPSVVDPATGAAAVGALTTVVDVLAGSLVGRVVAPDWMATADLSLHLAGPVGPGPVVVDAAVVRDGRTTVVVDAVLRHGTDGAVGEAVLTFVRLPRQASNLDISAFDATPGVRTSFGVPPGERRSYVDLVGQATTDAATGVTTTALVDGVRNSFGALNGGVVAGLAAHAGAIAVDAARAASPSGAGGAPVWVADLVVHHLAQAKVGPVRTSATVHRRGRDGGGARVEVVDTGPAGGRRCVLAHVGTVAITPSGW